MGKSGNILIITYWPFNSAILNSYALPYIRIIRKILPADKKIFLFTLSPANGKTQAGLPGVTQQLAGEGIQLVNFNYSPFGLAMLLKFIYIFLSLIFLTYKNRVRYIHAWCTPGGAIGYILSLFTPTRLILDSFEPHAESMAEAGTWKKDGLAYRILFRLEKLQIKKAKEVICAASGMMDYSREKYGVYKPDYFVKPACVDLSLFKPIPKNYALVEGIPEDSVVCTYAGKFGDIYLTHEVFDFFKVAHGYWGNKFKVLLLTNYSEEEIAAHCTKSGLDRNVIIKRFVHHLDVPKYMSLADFAICPVRPVPSKRYCTPIKNGEYWAMGLPVVITKNISTDSDLIKQQNMGYVLNDLNDKEYLEAVKKMSELLADKALPQKIRHLAEIHRNYGIAQKIYQTIYA